MNRGLQFIIAFRDKLARATLRGMTKAWDSFKDGIAKANPVLKKTFTTLKGGFAVLRGDLRTVHTLARTNQLQPWMISLATTMGKLKQASRRAFHEAGLGVKEFGEGLKKFASGELERTVLRFAQFFALGHLFKKLIGHGVEFEDTMLKISLTIDQNAERLQRYGEMVMSLSGELSASFDDIGEVMSTLLDRQITTEDRLRALSAGTLKFSKVTGISRKQVAELAAQFDRITGGRFNMERWASTFLKVQQITKATNEELLTTAEQLEKIAIFLPKDLRDNFLTSGLAVSGILSDLGIEATDVMNAFREVQDRASESGAKIRSLIAIGGSDVEAATRDIGTFLRALQSGIQTLDYEQLRQLPSVFQEAFGLDAQTMLRLFEANLDQVDAKLRAALEPPPGPSELNRRFTEVMSTTRGEMEKLGQQVEILAKQFGTDFLDSVKGILPVITDGLRSFNAWVKELSPGTRKFMAWAVMITATTASLGILAGGLSGITLPFKILWYTLKGLILVTPLLGSGIAKLATGFWAAATGSAGFAGGAVTLLGVLKKIGVVYVGVLAMTKGVEIAAKLLGNAFEWLKSKIDPVAHPKLFAALSLGETIFKQLGAAAERFGRALLHPIDELGKLLDDAKALWNFLTRIETKATLNVPDVSKVDFSKGEQGGVAKEFARGIQQSKGNEWQPYRELLNEIVGDKEGKLNRDKLFEDFKNRMRRDDPAFFESNGEEAEALLEKLFDTAYYKIKGAAPNLGKGALIKPKASGTLVNVGEAGQSEVVAPLSALTKEQSQATVAAAKLIVLALGPLLQQIVTNTRQGNRGSMSPLEYDGSDEALVRSGSL